MLHMCEGGAWLFAALFTSTYACMWDYAAMVPGCKNWVLDAYIK
jgi:hypothetical protein